MRLPVMFDDAERPIALRGEPPALGVPPDHPVPLRGIDGRFPFTTEMAFEAGLSRHALDQLVKTAQVIRLFKGVHVTAGTRDTVDLRVSAVKLVAPASAVVCDPTAAWLHGADLLPPTSNHGVPAICIYSRKPGNRTRLPGVLSGERTLLDKDVVDLGGLRVTSPLRTACDLGRIRDLPRALAHADGMLGLGMFGHADLIDAVEHYRGMRWVTHLRAVAALADARSQSPPESMLRYHWIAAGLPTPIPQHPVLDALGREVFYLDLLDPVNGVAGEYDGKLFHGEDRRQHDEGRRTWIEANHPIRITVFTDTDLFGPGADPVPKLRLAYVEKTRRVW